MAAQIKKLNLRIAATKNIGKITKSMKMVAASKLRHDQARLEAGRPYADVFYRVALPEEDRPDFSKKADDGDEMAAAIDFDTSHQKNLMVAITSDRGLCGGVNSFITKCVRSGFEVYSESNKDIAITVFGEKGRGQLQRLYNKKLTYTIDENWKTPINFLKASAMADRVIEQEYDNAYLFFNRFNNSISYTTTRLRLPNFAPKAAAAGDDAGPAAESGGPAFLSEYEMELESREESLQNLYEFSMASLIYATCVENATSEQSSRMTAMDNASTNAGDMISKLTIKVNRARQAAITTELIEIISGASALDS